MPTVTVIEPTAVKKERSGSENVRLRVAGYARVSTDKDEQFSSYEAQVEYYTRYICSHPEWEFVKVYTDEGITATSIKRRTGFREMIRDALDGKIDLILTKSISRFARNTVDSLQTIRLLKEHGVEVFFEKENIRTFDCKGELLITVMSSLAQEESRSISQNVTWGMRESMKRGRAWVPYSVFLGYEKGKDGNFAIMPEQACLVRRIYGLYLQGYGANRIGQILESEEIAFSVGKKKWYGTTVASILQNEKYKGDALRQKTFTADFLTKEKVKNNGILNQYYIHEHHEAIISPELFERVQAEIAVRGMSDLQPIGKKLFSGRVVCGDCGSTYSPYTWGHRTGNIRLVWKCNRRHRNAETVCSSSPLDEEKLKLIFADAVNELQKSGKLLAVFEIARKTLFRTNGYLAEKRENEIELLSVRERLSTASDEEKELLDRRFQIAKRRLAEIEHLVDEIKAEENETDTYFRALSVSKKPIAFDERLWRNLLDFLTVNGKNSATVTFKGGIKIDVKL